MIVTSASNEKDVKQADVAPQFTADSPQISPLAVSSAISVTKSHSGVMLSFVNEIEEGSSVRHSRTIADKMIARSAREVERRPKSSKAHTNLGIALLNAGDINSAQIEFDAALAIDPTNYIASMKLARIKVAQDLLDDAAITYSALRTHYPKDPAPVLSLAYIAMRKEQYEAAAKLLRDAIRIGHKAITAKYFLGIVLLKLGRNQEAISTLRAAAHLEVRSPALYEALGVAYSVAGDFRRATVAFKTALSLTPWAQNAVRGLARALLELKQIDETVSLLTRYLEENAQDNDAKQLLAKAYAIRRQFRSAIGQLTQVWGNVDENDRSTTALRFRLANNIGTHYMDSGEVGQAEQWFLRAIKIGPDISPIPQNNLARVYILRKDVSRALDVLRAARTKFGDDPDTVLLIAGSLEKIGLYDDAIAQLRPIVTTGKATPELYAILGSLLAEDKQDYKTALQTLKEGYSKYSENDILGNTLAYVYLTLGDAQSARPILERHRVTIEDKWAQLGNRICLTATYGLLRIVEGDIEEGIRLYKKAEQLSSEFGDKSLARTVAQKKHLELARAYVRNRDFQAAYEQIRKGLAIHDGRLSYDQQLRALEKDIQPADGFLK